MRSTKLMPGYVEGSDGLRRCRYEFPGAGIDIITRDRKNIIVSVEKIRNPGPAPRQYGKRERVDAVVETFEFSSHRLSAIGYRLSPQGVTHE